MAHLPAEYAEGWAQDNAIYRTRAKKRWTCRAGGGGAPPAHAPDCPGVIEVGQPYVEYVGEVPHYQTGTRHSLQCALHHGYIRKAAP